MRGMSEVKEGMRKFIALSRFSTPLSSPPPYRNRIPRPNHAPELAEDEEEEEGISQVRKASRPSIPSIQAR